MTGYMHRLQCFPEDNNLEEDIVEANVKERSCAEESDDINDDSDEEQRIEPTVTHTAARRAFEGLERYFMEQGFNETLIAALETFSDAAKGGAAAIVQSN